MKIISKKSPCLGICKTNKKNTCIGCLRTTAEIKNWINLSSQENKSLWREIRNRRRNYCGNLLVKDQDRGMKKGFRGWQDNMAILNEDVPFDTVKRNFFYVAY